MMHYSNAAKLSKDCLKKIKSLNYESEAQELNLIQKYPLKL